MAITTDHQHIYGPRFTRADERRLRGEPTRPEEERFTAAVIAGGAASAAVFALGALGLAIIGFAGIAPRIMMALAGLGIGIAELSLAGAVAARYEQDVRPFASRVTIAELVGGLATELCGAIGGGVLSIIALAGHDPHLMLGVAVLVYGGSLVLGGAIQPQIAELVRDPDPRIERAGRIALRATGGVLALAGLASIVLGILSVTMLRDTYAASGAAILALATATLLVAAAGTGRFAHRLRELA